MNSERVEFVGRGTHRLARVRLPIRTVEADHTLADWECVVVSFVDPEREDEPRSSQVARLMARAREIARTA